MNNFEQLGLSPVLVQAVRNLGYEEPTPIQQQAIPQLLAGRDVLGQAQTGTGKTAAFALPLLQSIDLERREVQAVVITPTRELAIQVSQAVYHYGAPLGVRVLPVYGGQSYSRQMSRLEKDTQVVVGTPGRMLDLIRQGVLRLETVQFLVLDEADEMLKMGFIEDVEAILNATPQDRLTAMFSATMTPRVLQLAARYMHHPVEVTIEQKTRTAAAVEQRFHLVDRSDKLAALILVLEAEVTQSVLIFTKTRAGAAELSDQLNARGYSAQALHGDLDQKTREAVLRRFRQGHMRVLIGTDVMARGVDIAEVSHVINYDLPMTSDDYVHRIGRTGRAGREGMAITLATPGDLRALNEIQNYTRQRIQKTPLPTPEQIYEQRDMRFAEAIDAVIETEEFPDERALVRDLLLDGFDLEELAAAALYMARREDQERPVEAVAEPQMRRQRERSSYNRNSTRNEKGMARLRINLGRKHGVQARDVVGAVANEAGISSKAIGLIDIKTHETLFDVKAELVNVVLNKMQRSTLRGEAMQLSRA